MESHPFFSVIIPLYNKENFIAATLVSVHQQTFKKFEVIIVNDGSTDGSVAKANEFIEGKSQFQIMSVTNGGVSKARNKGIFEAKGQFVVLLDADDIWLEDHLSSLRSAIVKNNRIDVFYANYLIENKKGVFKNTYFNFLPPEKEGLYYIENYFKSSLRNELAWTSATCFRKRLLIEENLLFDPELVSNQDTDLWLRIGLNNPCIFIKKPTAIYKCYKEGLAKSKLIDNKYLLINKHEDIQDSKPFLKAYLDQNRFSFAIQYLQIGETEKAYDIFKIIDRKSLSFKRKLVMLLPKSLLKKLLFKG